MDPFSAVLDGQRARGAFLLRVLLDPPWAVRIEDEAPIAVVVMVHGEGWLRHDDTPPVPLRAGDVALVRGPDPYSMSDSPSTAPQVRIDADEHCWSLPDGRSLSDEMDLGVRSWGNAVDANCVMLVGCYDLTSQLTPLLLDLLPRTAVVRAAQWTSPLLAVLHDEIGREAPGQGVVLDRLLDLVLIEAVRRWFAQPESQAPQWWVAADDAVVGPALRALQADPSRPWTVASLAAVARASRAAFARRFTEMVGVPPMAFLTGWRLSMAADRLRDTDDTVAAVADAVGYSSPFALSTAFKRRYALSPAAYRRAAVTEGGAVRRARR